MEESLPLKMNREYRGKVHSQSSIPLENVCDLALYYTPGVYEVCLEIKSNHKIVNDFTGKNTRVAVISNGTKVADFGDIGHDAVLPLVESKSLIYQKLGGFDVVPLALDTKDPQVIANLILSLGLNFAVYDLTNLLPSTYIEVSKILDGKSKSLLFDDEVEGVVPVIAAGIVNALKAAEKDSKTSKIVIDSFNEVSVKLTEVLVKMGIDNIIVCDSKGTINKIQKSGDEVRNRIAAISNPKAEKGKLQNVIKEADVVVLLNYQTSFESELIKKMNEKPIVFSLSYPISAITPDNAEKAGAFIVSSLRSDRPNQVSNAIAFPGLVKGAIAGNAKRITTEMMVACAEAIASFVDGEDFCGDYLLPSVLDEGLVNKVSKAVQKAAKKTNSK